MTHTINLAEVDSDGAIREAAAEVSGDTRLGFLKKAGLAGGAAISGSPSQIRGGARVMSSRCWIMCAVSMWLSHEETGETTATQVAIRPRKIRLTRLSPRWPAGIARG